MAEINQKTLYFIMSTGRCGSSLLMSILGNSGADIGQKARESWDPGLGVHENSRLNQSVYYFDYSEALRPLCFISKPHMWLRKLLRLVAKYKFRKAVKTASFHKSNSARTPMLAYRYGYKPGIIVIYRHYSEQMSSAYQRHGDTVEKLANHYENINRQALFLVKMYGGCVICFEDITDSNQTEWSATLADYAGIEQARLLSSRDRLLKKRRFTKQQEMTFIDKAMDDRLNSVYTALQNVRNRVFESRLT